MDWRIGALAVLVQLAVSSNAALLTVTSLNNSGPGTLRDLIGAALPTDEIEFGVQGTINLSSAITISTALSVKGPGASKIIVSGGMKDRVVVVSGDPVIISGGAITEGR